MSSKRSEFRFMTSYDDVNDTSNARVSKNELSSSEETSLAWSRFSIAHYHSSFEDQNNSTMKSWKSRNELSFSERTSLAWSRFSIAHYHSQFEDQNNSTMKSSELSTNSLSSVSIDSRLQNSSISIDSLSQNSREFTLINDDVLLLTESSINFESSINQSAQSERKERVRLKQSKVTLFVRIACQYKHQFLSHEKQRDAFYSIIAVKFNKKSDRNLIKNTVRTKL